MHPDEQQRLGLAPPVDRLRVLLRMAIDKAREGRSFWLQCKLCSGYTVFQDAEEMFEFKRHRYPCRCGYFFDRESVERSFPASNILVWDEHEEKVEEVLESSQQCV